MYYGKSKIVVQQGVSGLIFHNVNSAGLPTRLRTLIDLAVEAAPMPGFAAPIGLAPAESE